MIRTLVDSQYDGFLLAGEGRGDREEHWIVVKGS